jgi:hypothetical protein
MKRSESEETVWHKDRLERMSGANKLELDRYWNGIGLVIIDDWIESGPDRNRINCQFYTFQYNTLYQHFGK